MHSFALVMPTSGLTTIAKLRTELPCCVGIGIPKFQLDSSIIFQNIAKSLMVSLFDFFLKMAAGRRFVELDEFLENEGSELDSDNDPGMLIYSLHSFTTRDCVQLSGKV